MMMTPNSYYIEYIQNKTVSEILQCIQELNQDIDSLITQAEKAYSSDNIIGDLCPSVDTRYLYTHQYLDKACEELAAAGGSYEPSAREIKDRAFQDSIPLISVITVERSGYFQGSDKRTFRIIDNKALLSIQAYKNDPSALSCYLSYETPTAEELFNQVRVIHVGEWKQHYEAIACDGEKWKVTVSYSDGREDFVVTGNNAYPLCFENLWNLFEAEEIPYTKMDTNLALQLAHCVLNQLSSLPEGFISSTSRVLNRVLSDNPKLTPSRALSSTELDSELLFKIDDYVKRMASHEGLYLDMTKHHRCTEGLPYNLSFIVTHLPQ